ncbi:ENTH domain-containing protein [Sordaria sp. MPI-SDFR-AT-0083]|nr:ENTH domain-containing protein [Sordaria sp. MPI-SDFR-AT-0083]
MGQIAQMTYGTSTEFYEIMDMLDKRLNDKGKNWRHVLKALKVMDYILHEGSEMVVTWAKQNIFVIKTLREFTYIDEDGKDVGNNVRIAAKDLSALLVDEERLREERTDRRAWKSRMQYGEEMPQNHAEPSRPRPRQVRAQYADEDDAEYKLAIEASKYQEEEDRKRRERALAEVDDDDLAKAIKLSKEEEERRRRELEETNASSLFDDTPAQTTQPQFTGFNQGYQQGSAVDFFANPLDQNQLQAQQTAYMNNAFTGYGQQPMGYQQQQTGYQNGFQPQPTGIYDPYGQQQQPQGFMPQATGYNPYANQQQQQQQPQFDNSSSTLSPGSNNPWASNNNQQSSAIKPMPTGSNNPFAQKSPYKAPSMPAMSSLPEQKTLSTFPQINVTSSNSPFNTFGSQSQQQQQPQQQQPQFQQQPQQPQRELSEHEQKLNALLGSGDGMDTFGNTGNLRIPAQHTAPGTFVNSAGAGLNRMTADVTGNNPFLKQQFTGLPTVSYGGQQMPAATGPAGMGMNMGYGGMNGGYQQQQMGNSNPFAAGGQQQQRQQQGGQGDLISF